MEKPIIPEVGHFETFRMSREELKLVKSVIVEKVLEPYKRGQSIMFFDDNFVKMYETLETIVKKIDNILS